MLEADYIFGSTFTGTGAVLPCRCADRGNSDVIASETSVYTSVITRVHDISVLAFASFQLPPGCLYKMTNIYIDIPHAKAPHIMSLPHWHIHEQELGNTVRSS